MCIRDSGRGNAEEEVVFSPRDNLRVNVFIIIIDSLKSELEKWRNAYVEINETFKIVSEIDELNHENLRKAGEHLVKQYHVFPCRKGVNSEQRVEMCIRDRHNTV